MGAGRRRGADATRLRSVRGPDPAAGPPGQARPLRVPDGRLPGRDGVTFGAADVDPGHGRTGARPLADLAVPTAYSSRRGARPGADGIAANRPGIPLDERLSATGVGGARGTDLFAGARVCGVVLGSLGLRRSDGATVPGGRTDPGRQ